MGAKPAHPARPGVQGNQRNSGPRSGGEVAPAAVAGEGQAGGSGWIPQPDGTEYFDLGHLLPPPVREHIIAEAEALGVNPSEFFTVLVRQGLKRAERQAA